MKKLAISLLFLSIVSLSNAQWQKIKGPEDNLVTCFAVSRTNIFAGNYDGLYSSVNKGADWSKVYTLDADYEEDLYKTVASEKYLIIGIEGYDYEWDEVYESILLSTDNGVTWSSVGTTSFDNYIHTILENGTNVFIGTYNGAFLSGDNGTSWTQINNGFINSNISSFAASGTDIYTATDDGVYVLSKKDTSWTKVYGDVSVNALAICGSNMYIGTYDSLLLVSSDKGAKWKEVTSGIQKAQIWSFAVSGTNVFAGTETGAFYLKNGETIWLDVNTGFTEKYVVKLGISGEDIYALTNDGILWKRPISEMTGK
jgi:hypothetical protein